MLLEKWLSAKGKGFQQKKINSWRRSNMADLTKVFDFSKPDYSIPSMPNVSYPSTDSKGNWNGYSTCQSTYSTQRPPVPYGQQNESTALAAEQGFKKLRGNPNEGRFLTFEMNGYALASNSGQLAATQATSKHDGIAQRFILHQTGSQFTLTSAVNKQPVKGFGGKYTIADLGAGKGHTVQAGAQYLIIDASGKVSNSTSAADFRVSSVTYDN